MVAIIGLLIILISSLIVVRIGAIALELTGLSTDVAAFQAQSAFSGVGFTTAESETIVSQPVRRKIVRILIVFGSAGITSTIATMIVAFIRLDSTNVIQHGGILAAGLLLIFIVARSKFIYKLMKVFIVKALSRSRTLQLHDYQELLGISKGYSVSNMRVKAGHWLVGQNLKGLELNKEGTLILSIHRSVDSEEKFIIPSGETVIQEGDRITAYGRCANAECLYNRTKANGDQAHQKRCEIEKKLKEVQEVAGGVVE